MKNPMYRLMTLTAAVMIMFTACKKTNNEETTPETATHSDDQSQFTAEIDAVTDEANELIKDNPSFNFRNTSGGICDATWTVDSNATTKSVTITFTGGNCSGTKNRTRTGSVVLSMPKAARWSDAGAALTISFQNVKITRLSDKKSLTLNGNIIARNVSGGNIVTLANSGSLTHTITSEGITVKFADGTSRTWMVAKTRNFSYDNGIVISTSGNHSDGTVDNISEWGVNRGGETFKTVISQPLVIRQDCSFRVTSGKIEYITNIKLAITFGLNMLGEPTGCPGTGNYFFKAEYTDLRSITHTLIWPY